MTYRQLREKLQKLQAAYPLEDRSIYLKAAYGAIVGYVVDQPQDNEIDDDAPGNVQFTAWLIQSLEGE